MADSLYTEVRAYIQDQLDAGVIVRAEWITAGFLANKAEPDCEDADFYLLCARSHLAEVVKRCIGKYTAKPETDSQLVLPGFDHLQRGYQVDREGVRVLVPTDLLTDEELEARAAEYGEMAKGCIAHAKEIRAFIKARAAAQKASAA